MTSLWLVPGNLGFRRVSTFQTIKVVYCAYTVCASIMVSLNTCFPSGSLEFCCVLNRGCLRDSLSIKFLSIESLVSFPHTHIMHVLPQFVAVKIEPVLCFCWERTLTSVFLVSLNFILCVFSFC